MKAARISFRDQRSAPPGWQRRAVHLVLLVIVVWFGGFLAFAAAIPPQVRNTDTPVDAIVRYLSPAVVMPAAAPGGASDAEAVERVESGLAS